MNSVPYLLSVLLCCTERGKAFRSGCCVQDHLIIRQPSSVQLYESLLARYEYVVFVTACPQCGRSSKTHREANKDGCAVYAIGYVTTNRTTIAAKSHSRASYSECLDPYQVRG